MLELKREKLSVKIDGQVYELARAKVQQLKELSSIKNDADGVQKTIDFIVSSGLPKEVVESLEADHVAAIMEALTGAKKK